MDLEETSTGTPRRWMPWVIACAILVSLLPFIPLAVAAYSPSGSSQPASTSAQAPTQADTLVAPPGHPSWQLVPGNHCWDDKAGVLRQLHKQGYDMDTCAQNDGGLWVESWTQSGWPTVRLFQRAPGAPITFDAMYEPGAKVSLTLVPASLKGKPPAAQIIQAGQDVLARSDQLRRQPYKGCGFNERVVRAVQAVAKWRVAFDFTYSSPTTSPTHGSNSSCPV